MDKVKVYLLGQFMLVVVMGLNVIMAAIEKHPERNNLSDTWLKKANAFTDKLTDEWWT